MTDRELLEQIAAQVGTLTKDVSELKEGQKKIEIEVKDIKKTVINIEDDHGKKLQALFDGYIQNSDKLERIEKEVSKQEEVILRKIK